MKYNKVYIVVNEGIGIVEYASTEREKAHEYAEEQFYKARQVVLDAWENDDPTDENIVEADFQAGLDGACYQVVKVNLEGKTEDDVIELSDGIELEVSDILENLK